MMGTNWYAVSGELLEVNSALEDLERRIFAPNATAPEMDEAIDAREVAYELEASARAELEQRGGQFSFASTAEWPMSVRTQLAAFGPWLPNDQLLTRLGWTTYYYAENLRLARVPMEGFSARLDYFSLAPRDVKQLGEELLQYAASKRSQKASDAARVAGLWLYVWGCCDCHVEAGQ